MTLMVSLKEESGRMLSEGVITPETITSVNEILKVLLQGKEPSDESRVKLVIGQSGCEGTS